MEVALITLVFLLIVVLLYYGFQPGDSAYLIVTPILFFLKVPFAVPMILGLTGSLVSVISDELRDFSVLRDSVCEAERKLLGRQ